MLARPLHYTPPLPSAGGPVGCFFPCNQTYRQHLLNKSFGITHHLFSRFFNKSKRHRRRKTSQTLSTPHSKPPKKQQIKTKPLTTQKSTMSMSVTAWHDGIRLGSLNFENQGIGLISNSVLKPYQAVLVHHGRKPISKKHEQYILFNIGNVNEFVDISIPRLLRSLTTPHLYYLNAADWHEGPRAKKICEWHLACACPTSVLQQIRSHCSQDPSVYNVVLFTTDTIHPNEELLVNYTKLRWVKMQLTHAQP